jgi:hypothetical protein
MHCPHFAEKEQTGVTALCLAVILPFKPTAAEQQDYCKSGLHEACSLHRTARRNLSRAIHQEVARAIG